MIDFIKNTREQVLPRKLELVLEAPRGARKTSFTALKLKNNPRHCWFDSSLYYMAAMENPLDQRELIIKEVLH